MHVFNEIKQFTNVKLSNQLKTYAKYLFSRFLMSKFVPAAKKMMSLVSGRGDADSAASSSSSSSLSLRAKKNKRKLYRPEISSPMDMPSHPVSLDTRLPLYIMLILPTHTVTLHQGIDLDTFFGAHSSG